MIEIIDVRHSCPEPAGITIERPLGHPSYTFLHLYNPVDIMLNGEIIHTKPHACILYNQLTPQYLHSEVPLLNDWIHFGPGLDEHFLAYGLKYDTVFYPENPDFITLIIREMEQEFYTYQPYKETILAAKTDELFIKCARLTNKSPSPVSSDFTLQFTYLRTMILSQPGKNWTIQAMASQVGLGRSKFHSIYKSLFGISPVNDLINMRISAAKTLLLHSDNSITEIAEQLGYNNLAHFTKQFRAIVGLSPGQFRTSPQSDSNTPARVDMTQILSDALAYHYKTQQQYHEVRYIKSNKQ